MPPMQVRSVDADESLKASTPTEHRAHGYASAVTAAASGAQLAAGRTFCFLYTDLANAIANRIYVDIGYEPVCDSVEYVFERPEVPT
jgi:predicted GNAT family acetyltransferase